MKATRWPQLRTRVPSTSAPAVPIGPTIPRFAVNGRPGTRGTRPIERDREGANTSRRTRPGASLLDALVRRHALWFDRRAFEPCSQVQDGKPGRETDNGEHGANPAWYWDAQHQETRRELKTRERRHAKTSARQTCSPGAAERGHKQHQPDCEGQQPDADEELE